MVSRLEGMLVNFIYFLAESLHKLSLVIMLIRGGRK